MAKYQDTYSQFMAEDYKDEAKYINSLNDDEKIWLNTFLQGYYHRSKPAMDILKFPVMLRRSRYNQHRGACNDIYNKKNKVNLTDTTILESVIQTDEETGEGLVKTKTLKKKVKEND